MRREKKGKRESCSRIGNTCVNDPRPGTRDRAQPNEARVIGKKTIIDVAVSPAPAQSKADSPTQKPRACVSTKHNVDGEGPEEVVEPGWFSRSSAVEVNVSGGIPKFRPV